MKWTQKLIDLGQEVFSFENVGKAYQSWESSQVIGKIILENNW
jgi:hypothetical protein